MALCLAASALAVGAAPAAAAPGAGVVIPAEVVRAVGALDARHGSDLSRAAAAARAATAWQHSAMGLVEGAVAPGARHELPSEALLTLAGRHGVEVDTSAGRAIERLDRLAAPLRGAVTEVVDAFLAFQSAAEGPGAQARGAGRVLAARGRLLDSAVALDAAIAAAPSGALTAAAPLSLCPAVALDLAGGSDTYTADCALVIDVGGHDTYHNNAGGTFGLVSAALIDLAGEDRYGNPSSPRSNGANGGASGALFIPLAGFLLDGGGNDQYVAGFGGVNGGGYSTGIGFLVDAGGTDTYTAGNFAANGGGNLFGSGLLVDGGGNDAYTGKDGGVNGGTFVATGALVDGGGDDTYVGGTLGSNGGTYAGDALLVDRAGNDSYTAGAEGANGTAGLGTALLLDLGGTDAYSDQARTTSLGFEQTCNGSGTDRSVIPKCRVGAQVDSTNPGGVTLPPLPAPPPGPSFGSIAGTVADSSTKAGIVGARVDCGGVSIGVAGPGGGYRIALAPAAATLTCTATAVGYRAKSQQVTVVEGKTASLDFHLRKA